MSTIKEISFRSASGHSHAHEPKARLFALRIAVSGLARAVRNRLAADSIRDLDDRMLDDIGLTRADVENVFATTGTFEDPTPGLTRAVRARAWRRFAAIYR